MPRIEARNLSVEYPIFNAGSMLLRNALIAAGTGGTISRGVKNIVTVKALDGATFTIEEGDRVGLVGHNGAGKSTLLRVLGGIYSPTSGNLRVNGRTAGIFALGAGLDGELTGYENIVRMGMLLGLRKAEALQMLPDVEAFTELVAAGKIRHWGVSNFDVADLEELESLPGGKNVASDQVLYNVTRRGIEFELLPRTRAKDINVMAYTPIEQGRILGNTALREVARRHNVSPAQIALAWTIRSAGVVSIPRSGSPAHTRENAAAAGIELTDRDLQEIDRAFAPPKKSRPLEML